MKENKQLLLIQKDLIELKNAWEEILVKKRKASDTLFLQNLSTTIIKLHSDIESIKQKHTLTDEILLLRFLITTPWGAPFVFNSTLIEAAYSFATQQPLSSDLCHWVNEASMHYTPIDDPFYTLLDALEKKLDKIK